ncbi:hypothetical protein LTR66_011352 [Elasticomyces elasticus]|nr:hypothetical protein LTR66_011352 [Elasticomyces elasticus]
MSGTRGSISTCRDDEEDGDLVLGWLNSPHKEKFNPDPFSIYYETSIHEKYTAYWKRFTCYCLRLLHADDRHGHAFSAREQESLRELWGILELEDENEAALNTRVFDLNIPFWMYEDRAHSKSAIVRFCAELRIDGKKGCYRPPSDYGQILATLLYCARLLMFEHALPADKREHIVNPCKTFLHIHHRWLIDGRLTPFHFVDNLLAYALGAGKDVGGKPRVQWSADKQTVIYQGQRLHLSQLRDFVTQLCDAAVDIFYKDLMFLPDPSMIRSIDLRGRADDMNDSTIGYSFVTDRRNDLHGGRERMLNRLGMSPERAALLELGSDGFELESKGWRKYQSQLEKFKDVLFILMHICGEAPARGTEIFTVRHTNAAQNMRNIFVLDEEMVFVTVYHKSQAVTRQHKVVPRFLPGRVRQSLVVYLADILPFITLVDRNGVSGPLRSFLWVDRKRVWNTSRATRALTQETSIRMAYRITFQDYRHIAIAIDREHVRGLMGDTDDDQDDLYDLGAAHSSRTADQMYGIDASMLRSLSARSINASREVTDWWHWFLQVNSR